VSYVDVLRGAVPADALTGRYVLVGMTAQGMGDTLATPVNADQRAMPGVEVLAHQLDTLRSGRAVHALSPALVASASALAVVLLVSAFRIAGTRPALLLAVAAQPLALGWRCCSCAGTWGSPASLMLVAALAYPCGAELERVSTARPRDRPVAPSQACWPRARRMKRRVFVIDWGAPGGFARGGRHRALGAPLPADALDGLLTAMLTMTGRCCWPTHWRAARGRVPDRVASLTCRACWRSLHVSPRSTGRLRWLKFASRAAWPCRRVCRAGDHLIHALVCPCTVARADRCRDRCGADQARRARAQELLASSARRGAGTPTRCWPNCSWPVAARWQPMPCCAA
jgi:hypothetical protein